MVREQRRVILVSYVLAAALPISCSSGAAGPPPPSPIPSHVVGATPAVIANCEKPAVPPRREPHRIVAACGGDAVFILAGIRYTSWAEAGAAGTAHLRYNSCHPDCAAGRLVTAKASFRLTTPRRVRGHLVFTTVFVHSRSGPTGRYPLVGRL